MGKHSSATLEFSQTKELYGAGQISELHGLAERKQRLNSLDGDSYRARLKPVAVPSRSSDIELVFALAFDRARRRYVVIRGEDDDGPVEVLEEATAIAIARQIQENRVGATTCGLSRGIVGQQLNRKEILVLQGVADGLTNRAIASRLRITENTAKRHLQSIFIKLGVSSRTQAVMVALARGWISTTMLDAGT